MAAIELLAAFALCWAGLSVASALPATTDLEVTQAFLAAEKAPMPEALKLWKALLKDVSQRDTVDLPAYLSTARIQGIIIDLQTRQYPQSGNEQKAIEAYEYIDHLADRDMRLWGLVYFLHQVTQYGGLQERPALLRAARDGIHDVYFDAFDLEPKTRQRLYYALATVLTSEGGRQAYTEKEMRLVHTLIVNIQDPKHRLDLMRRFGTVAKSFSPAVYPVTFQRLYLVLGQMDPQEEPLLAIHKESVRKDHFHAALYALLAIPQEKMRTARLKEYFQDLMKQGDISRARRVADQTDNASACVYMWSDLMREYLYYGYDQKATTAQDRAMACAGTIDNEASRRKALQLVRDREASGRKKHGQYTRPDAREEQSLRQRIDDTLAGKGVVTAAGMIRDLGNTKLRVNAFHYLARRQAESLDRYALLQTDAPTGKITDTISYFLDQESGKSAFVPVEVNVKTQEETLRKRYGSDATNVMVYTARPSSIGKAIHHNALPQQAKISGETVRARLPLPAGGRVILSHYESNIFNSSFTRLFGNSGFILGQQTASPLVITIENGVVDIMTIYDELTDMGNVRCLERQRSIYTLRCPLIVGSNATLVMSGDNLSEMRLSTQSGSYLLNANVIFMTDITLIGWDDTSNRPMWTGYEKHYYFRPFFTSWNRSFSYIGNSEIIALGYDHGKSYGISFSSGPNNWENLGEIDSDARPTGTIVNNSFRNMMFGFYSFEAYNVVIVGNEYVDNIYYGPDPHDRSTYLTIAYNTVYGTAKRHGIILSREVKNSVIAGNLSFDNRGSGIMLDRASDENLIYANTAFENQHEGITLFESNCNIIAANKLFDNKGSGVRLRNSHDVGVYYNQMLRNNHGITAYTLVLEEDPNHAHRDFVMDPYANITTLAAIGNRIQENKTGIYAEDIDGLFLKQNVFLKQAPELFRGDWFATRMQDIMQMDPQEKGATISRLCPTTRTLPVQHGCMFRENRTLLGDGMDLLMDRLNLPQCQKMRESIRTAKKEGA